MAAFVRPFNRSEVLGFSDATAVLPDPLRGPGDPIIRPGVARYASRTLILLRVNLAAGSSGMHSPVTGVVRHVDLPGVLGGVDQLLEIEPLPFHIAPALKSLPPGSPTFYVGYPGAPGLLADGDLLEAGTVLYNGPSSAYLGVFFQDGVTLHPWTWIELLRKAMERSGDATGASAWNELANLYAAVPRTVRLLDHDGRPMASASFNMTVNGQPAGGVATGSGEMILPPGEIGLSWQGNPVTGDTTLPVHSLYERFREPPNEITLSAPPAGQFILPTDFQRGHVQLLDLSRWYSIPPAGSPAARFHPNCRIEPLVDGIPTYRRIVDDLIASRGSEGSAYFSGLIFNNFELDKGRMDPLSPGGSALDTTLVGLKDYIRGGGGEVRMLMDKFLELKDPGVVTVKRVALLLGLCAALSITVGELFISRFKREFPTDSVGFYVLWGLDILSVALLKLVTTSSFESLEPSHDVFGELNANENEKYIALWARYPVRIGDNSLADHDLFAPGFRIEDIQDRLGFWHQKIQAIMRSEADLNGNRIIGFIGGIDINKNRMDTAGHQHASGYHDVHSRVTGTAAWDIHKSFRDAYDFTRSQYLAAGEDSVPVLTADLPDYRTSQGDYPDQPQKHLIQIGRTYFQADETNGGEPLPFSEAGERTTYDTYLRAIKEAKSYIHLEDQYFTPNSSLELNNPNVFFDALLAAATTCKRLVIIIPREGDQPFGGHRRAFLIGKLREAWRDRLFIGVPLRRPFLVSPGYVASVGRALLREDVAALSSGPLWVGPPSRIPKAPPFWLWIYGELMLCTRSENDLDSEGQPAMRLTVVRGGDWRAKPKTHKKGAPVTFSQLKGPFVHAKVIIVDDAFVGIGSTNINRRAFFHDGEIHAFAVPEQLRSAADNPALALRTALWAEHLGIPPALGAALLADPITAFEYFRRSFIGGNRSAPVEVINELPHFGLPFKKDAIRENLENVLAITLGIFGIWNTISDPTTNLDPRPTSGPLT